MKTRSLSRLALAAFFACIVWNIFSAEPTNNDMIHHRDPANGFAIWYPKTWGKVPTTHEATKLKIVSRNGAGGDDFSVVVISNPALKKITPDRLVEMYLKNSETLLAQLRKVHPDLKVIKTGKTHLDSKPAHYIIFDATFRSVDLEIPMRFMQVTSVNEGKSFTLTSRSAPNEFETLKAVFTIIMGGFRFLDR